MTENSQHNSDILIYQSEDGTTRIDVRLEGETVWLTLYQMVELFQRDKSVISRHIKNIYDEGELEKESTVADFAMVQYGGDREVLNNVGTISHEKAQKKAIEEYEKFYKKMIEETSSVEKHFLEAVERVKKLEGKDRE